MKLIILTLGVGLFLSSALAQSNEGEAGLFNAAFVAGVNLSQIDGDAAAGYNKIGINIGGRAGIQFSERFELSFEILYSQKGAYQRARGNPFFFHTRLDYIEIPLEANLHEWLVEDAKGNVFSRIVFGAGLSYNQLLLAKRKESGIEVPLFEENYKKHNLMITISPTVFFTHKWGVNFRWSRSLYTIRKKDSSNSSARAPAEILHMLSFRGIYKF